MAKNKNNGVITSQNSFEGGLVADLHVMASPSNTVRGSLNMELVTIGADQYIYQNIRGSRSKVDWNIGPDFIFDNKSYPFTPLGIKVHNDVAYILAGAFEPDGTFLTGMIGTFPSPNWTKLNDPDDGESYLEEEFRAIHNFRADGASDEDPYIDPFITEKFQFEKNRHIDIDIQGDFDSSVNIIFTDNLNKQGIINSRFKRLENNNIAYLAERANNNDSNTYSNDDWERVGLIQNSNFPVKVRIQEIGSGGYLRGGGYRYYFKYATQEGNTTEILYESPLIPISNGELGLTKDQISDKKVIFELEELDNSYAGIKVYFAHFDGEPQATSDIFVISSLYTFNTNTSDTIVITHTGLEDIEAVDASEINAAFTPLDTVRTSTIINDRLAIAGITSTLREEDVTLLADAAKRVTLWERKEDVTKAYSDPKTAAEKLGYWKGEVYEFAIVFMLTNKGLSPAFPTTGMDNIDGTQNPSFEYPADLGLNDDGFSEDGLVFNQKGLFRTSNSGLIYTPGANGVGIRHITYIEADTSTIDKDGAITNLVSGFFIVRRERIKNVLMQGMMVPTLKVPTKSPTVATWVEADQAAMDASKRHLMQYFAMDRPTIGLNSKYNSVTSYSGVETCKIDFATVFVPQVSQLLNVLTYDKAWIVNGSIGQDMDDIKYQKTITRDEKDTKKMHMVFMSADLDINIVNVRSDLNGVNPSIEIQKAAEIIHNEETIYRSPMVATSALKYESPITFDFNSPDTYNIYLTEPIGYREKADWVNIGSENITATLLDSGAAVFSKGAFTAKVDRTLGFYGWNESTDSDDDSSVGKATFGTPFYQTKNDNTRSYTFDYSYGAEGDLDYNAVGSSARTVAKADGILPKDQSFRPYSVISQSYSSFLGIEVDVIVKSNDDYEGKNKGDEMTLPAFYFDYFMEADPDTMVPPPTSYIHPEILDERTRVFVQTGHLANIFRSSKGRWESNELPILYKYDNGDPYFAASNRVELIDSDTNTTVAAVSIYRGDCFITKLTKKVAYKNGIPDAKSATSADAGTYGIGITGKISDEGTEAKDVADDIRYDKGRNLFDVGHTVEIAAQTNINADIRSIQNLSDEDTKLYGGERDFFPHKKEIFGDARPDSASYNHGYTGDEHIITYNRIEENSPVYNTSFPNRILLSERNQTQSFFNSFRDIKGFNFRDYGIELGPIVKIIAIKNILLSVHPGGVLAIGVDDKTLIAEGSDVYVDTAQALSPTSKTVSDVYGSVNPESIVKTDITVAGVDYNSSAVWLFEGNKLSIISEFAIKTILEKYKAIIVAKDGIARVYSTFDFVKHALIISYVSENRTDKTQESIGTVIYNTALQRWSSEISEGNKFSMSMGSRTFTTGFTQSNGLVNGIWEEDALKTDAGVDVRNRLRGIQYPYEFEFTINMQPSVEKILDNLLVITNKVLPEEIIYTTSNDNNDAAVNVWGQDTGEMEVIQKIVTRNKSTRRGSRLGILEENAYYKNSDLYISVNQRGSMSRNSEGNKRIRDKHIKVKFVYSGSDETFLQAIISMLSISYS